MVGCSFWLVAFILFTFYVLGYVVVVAAVDPVVESLDVSAFVGKEVRLQETPLCEYLVTAGALQGGSLRNNNKLYYAKNTSSSV